MKKSISFCMFSIVFLLLGNQLVEGKDLSSLSIPNPITFKFKNATNDATINNVSMIWSTNNRSTTSGSIIIDDCSTLENWQITFSSPGYQDYKVSLVYSCKMKTITFYLYPDNVRNDPNKEDKIKVTSLNSFNVLISELNPATGSVQNRFTNARAFSVFNLGLIRDKSTITFGTGTDLPQVRIISGILDDAKIDVILDDSQNPYLTKRKKI